MLDASFAHCSSTLLRGGRGEKHKIVQITVFPIIFVTDCLKNLQNFTCVILQLLILNQIEGMYLPITSLLYESFYMIIFGTQRSSLNTFIRQNLYFSDFFQIKPNYEHYKEDSTRCIIVHEIAALET